MQNLPDWARFAPSLAHLVPRIEEFDPVLCGWSSGPQFETIDYDPNEPQHLTVCVDNPWHDPDQWIIFYSDKCRWFDDDGEYIASHDDVFAYLAQLPRRLHHFGRLVE